MNLNITMVSLRRLFLWVIFALALIGYVYACGTQCLVSRSATLTNNFVNFVGPVPTLVNYLIAIVVGISIAVLLGLKNAMEEEMRCGILLFWWIGLIVNAILTIVGYIVFPILVAVVAFIFGIANGWQDDFWEERLIKSLKYAFREIYWYPLVALIATLGGAVVVLPFLGPASLIILALINIGGAIIFFIVGVCLNFIFQWLIGPNLHKEICNDGGTGGF